LVCQRQILLIMEFGFLSARRRILQVSHLEAIFDTSFLGGCT